MRHLLLCCFTVLLFFSCQEKFQNTSGVETGTISSKGIRFAVGIDLGVITKDGKQGVVRKDGSAVIPIIYEKVQLKANSDLIALKKNGKWALTNSKNQVLFDFEYEQFDLKNIEGELLQARKDGKQGVLHLGNNSVFIPFEYDRIDLVNTNGNLLFTYKEGKNGVLDVATGEKIMPTEYEKLEIGLINEKLLRVYQEGKVGLFDVIAKEEAVACKFDFIDSFLPQCEHCNPPYYIATTINDKWGLLGRDGREAIPAIYDQKIIPTMPLHTALAVLNGKKTFVKYDGTQVVPAIYDEIAYYSAELVAVQKDSKWGLVNQSGQQVLDQQYDTLILINYPPATYLNADSSQWRYETSLYEVVKDNETYLVDMSGKRLFSENRYDSVKRWYGLDNFLVAKDSKWGFADIHGKEFIPLVYEKVGYFHNGLASVKKDGKWGVIDRENNQVIPFEYDHIGIFANLDSFEYSYATVCKNGKCGFIDKSGEVVIDMIYDEVLPFQRYDSYGDPYALVRLNTKWGAIDEKGKIITPIKYSLEELSYND